MVIILLYVFWLGAINLDTNPLVGDEWNTVDDIGGVFSPIRTFSDLTSNLALTNPWHVPGYYVVLSLWIRVVGAEDFSIRLLSVFMGLLAVAVIARTTCLIKSPRSAIIAALLLGTSLLIVHYIAKARMYIQLLLVCEVVIYCYFLARIKLERRLLPLFLASAFLIYTHYMGLIILGTLGLYHIVFPRPKPGRWHIIFVFLLAAFSFLPWSMVLLNGISAEAELQRPALTLLAVLERFLYLFGNGNLILGIVFVAAGLFVRGSAKRLWILALTSLVALLLLHSVMDIITFARARYLLIIWPFFVLLTSVGFDFFVDRFRAAPVAGFALVLFLVLGAIGVRDRTLSQETDGFAYVFPWHMLQRGVSGWIQENDMVMAMLPDNVNEDFWSASRDAALFYSQHFPGDYAITVSEFYEGQANEEAEYRRGVAQSRERIWLTYLTGYPARTLPEFQSVLSDSRFLCPNSVQTGDVRVDQYARHPVCCISLEESSTQMIEFGDWFNLLAISFDAVSNNGILNVFMSWEVEEQSPMHEYSVTLQLFNSQGEKVAQNDYGLQPLSYFCPLASLNIADLEPGQYELRTGVYNWQTGTSLLARDLTSGTEGMIMVPLKTMTIER